MDKVIIKNLLVRGIIGINDWEREKPQDILINIEITTDLRKAGESDQIEDCVNYRTIAKKVFSHTEQAQRFTVEALANDIAGICLQEPLAHTARVRVEKPGAVRFADSVGVEVFRSREG
ncbi:MAG: dihydroneopterin aldolase [Anaerolineales bacterium]|nr:dihydroneopterin aldolase [Anaerolineales bacterium]